MNRRHFLQGKLADVLAGDQAGVSSASDLTPYTPRPDKPWNARRAAHLMRRTGFGCTQEELTAALASTPAALVDTMLAQTDNPTLFWNWTRQPPFDDTVAQEVQSQFYVTWVRDLQFWWLGMMMQPNIKLREKMVLFWHGHFVSDLPKVQATQYLYDQNRLFRGNAFGSFKELTKQITINPAMLIYLDGAGSAKGIPNENYARELMELFTIGIGSYSDGTPHYAEQDIIEMARALTGWTINHIDRVGEFNPDSFDNGNKTLFGHTDNYGVGGQGNSDALDLIFDLDDKDLHEKRSAIFLCTKLYLFFAYEVPNLDIIKQMAGTLVANNWQIGPVLRELFTSEHFFDDVLIGGMIKSPVDMVMGAMNQFKLSISINVDPGDPESHDPLRAMSFLSQTIFYPPNVKGWIGGKNWISTATLPLRIRYLKLWIQPPDLVTTAPYNFKPVDFIKALPNPTDVHAVLDDLLTLIIPVPVSDRVRSSLLDALLGGAPDYEWDPDTFEQRIRTCLVQMTALGEFQLM